VPQNDANFGIGTLAPTVQDVCSSTGFVERGLLRAGFSANSDQVDIAAAQIKVD
jgi:hypothetical protein